MSDHLRRLVEQDAARRARAEAHLAELTAAFCDRILADHAEDEHDRLVRLMCTPPSPRETRARHTSGGQHR
ncbi:hypothetical protein [Streptomyces sp. NPDC002054]|uniref:hypothetical protein n=1 Tax=Streptomyces sp. NPDC002054 TaxID=3154663 RepID=UPI0033182D1C